MLNQDRVNKAIEYLRARNKYIVDTSNTFKPTCAAATDVKATWDTYRKTIFADLGADKAADTKAKAWSRSLAWAQKNNLIRVENNVFFVVAGQDTESAK